MTIEKIVDNTYAEDGRVFGQTRYQYLSPTHWGSDGVCCIVVRFTGYRAPQILFSWSAGGVTKESTDIEVAEAMSQGFARASVRLAQLNRDFPND